MNKFNISKGDLLTEVVARYELSRKEGRIWIDVYKPLAGAKISLFFAIPTLVTKVAKEKYIGEGSTKEGALNNCLLRIKDVSYDEILR